MKHQSKEKYLNVKISSTPNEFKKKIANEQLHDQMSFQPNLGYMKLVGSEPSKNSFNIFG